MKTVIIGNSVAAVGCVEGIRWLDKSGEIVIISTEKHHVYGRPLISYLLLGKTDRERIKYRPRSFYKDNKVKTMLGRTAERIDTKHKLVILKDGESTAYDRLVVATGSSPFLPELEGLEDVKSSFTFMTLDDAIALGKAVTAKSRVLILGAGLIGLKCAEGISGRAASITVVDLASRVLPSILDEDGSEIVKAHLEKQGVKFHLNSGVTSVKNGTAMLKGGGSVEFDVFVTAVGVRPNTKLIADLGGDVNRGIVINERCETSIPDIYAVGDCSEGYDSVLGEKRVLALLPNAYMQGECAGINIAGGEAAMTSATAMNSIGFMGLHLITAGVYAGEKTVIRSDGAYKAFFVKDSYLVGFIIIGDVARAGIYTSLVKNKTPLDTVDFELLKEHPQLAAFSKQRRAEMLSKEA